MGKAEGFIVRRPDAPESIRAIGKIIDFIEAQNR